MSAAELKATAASLRCRLDVSATTPVAEAFRAGRLALFAAKRILKYKEKRHFHLARALEQHFDDAPVPTDVAGQRVLKQVLEEHCYGAALELYNILGLAAPSYVVETAREEENFGKWADSGFATRGRME